MTTKNSLEKKVIQRGNKKSKEKGKCYIQIRPKYLITYVTACSIDWIIHENQIKNSWEDGVLAFEYTIGGEILDLWVI